MWVEKSSYGPFDLLMKWPYQMFSSAEIQHLETEILFFLKTVSHFLKCPFSVYVQLIEEVFIFIGVGDLLHCRVPCEVLRGKDRERAILAAVRQSLKKANYENFDTLLEAFRHYNKVSALKKYKCKAMCNISAPVLWRYRHEEKQA